MITMCSLKQSAAASWLWKVISVCSLDHFKKFSGPFSIFSFFLFLHSPSLSFLFGHSLALQVYNYDHL